MKRTTTAPSVVTVVAREFCEPAIPVPQLQLIATDELYRGFQGCEVVRTLKGDFPFDPVVSVFDVDVVLRHVIHQKARSRVS